VGFATPTARSAPWRVPASLSWKMPWSRLPFLLALLETERCPDSQFATAIARET
jgi:hypothetical protein